LKNCTNEIDNKLFSWGVLSNAATSAIIGAGDSGSVARGVPVAVTSFTNKTISKISVGMYTAQALFSDGTLYAVGDNSYALVSYYNFN
jgi:alpha-tubulin suppressor-like RCC1 family protein